MARKTKARQSNTKITPRELLDRTTTEKAYQQQIIDYAKLRGYLVYHTFYSGHSAYGFPDLTLCKPGCRMRFLEVKSESGKLTAAQREWIRTIRATGNYARVVRPSDWKIITQILSDDLQELEFDLEEMAQ